MTHEIKDPSSELQLTETKFSSLKKKENDNEFQKKNPKEIQIQGIPQKGDDNEFRREGWGIGARDGQLTKVGFVRRGKQ